MLSRPFERFAFYWEYYKPFLEQNQIIKIGSLTLLYYDCTNYFFEIEQEDGDKRCGKCKENRPNPIVTMGLFMDADGIPPAFDIFPGNQNEQTTL